MIVIMTMLNLETISDNKSLNLNIFGFVLVLKICSDDFANSI